MRGAQLRPVVIAAGGTGGHFFPATALADELVARGDRVVLMTDARSAAMAAEGFAGREQFVLRGAGIAGRGLRRGAQAMAALAGGTWQARGILARLNAAAVVGFGGYPSVAPILGARLLRRRPALLLHEQNAVLGRANRALARLVDTLATSLPTAGLPAAMAPVLVGNPVRPALRQLAGAPYQPPGHGPICLLVLGGSLGARVFSDVVPAALRLLPAALAARLHVVQQCRAEDLDRVRAAYAASGISAELAPFFADIASLLDRAQMVIARAGASTIAELAVVGRPALLVPLPGAIDDHQSANALALVQAGGAAMLRQADFTPQALAARLAAMLEDDAGLSAAALASAGCGRADAASRLADLVAIGIARRAEAAGVRP